MIYNKTLKNHVQHLHTIFDLLRSRNISFSSIKNFLNYSSVQLLKQKVNAFDFIIVVEKIEIIVRFQFSKTLKNFEIYFEFTEWLRHYISYFAQKSNSLQQRKANFFRLTFTNKNVFRKFYAARIDLNFVTTAERELYEQLQKTFNRQKFLFYFTSIKTLYADIDVSKSYDFDAMIYHTAVSYENFIFISRVHVQFIMFLSKMLNIVETKYWSTKLEVAILIWMIKKIRHIIETAIKTTVIFIDHFASTLIARQTFLNFSNIDKLNLKFVKAFAYLSQFDFDVRYKLNKTNIVFDALFRLSTINNASKSTNVFWENCQLFEIFQISLIIMTNDFKQKLAAEYFKDIFWAKIIKTIRKLKKRLKNEKIIRKENQFKYENDRIDMNFEMHDDLIYHKKRQRLCISTDLDKEIFDLTHDKNQHFEINRCYARISESLYLSHLSKNLKQYIAHCSQC